MHGVNSQRILILEDDRTIQSLMKFGLAKAGYQVSTAGDGEAGKKLIEQTSPNLIFLDLHMPNMDGLQFLHWVREEQKKKMPIVVISAEPQRTCPSGANAYLSKPVSLKTLLSTINHFMKI